MILLALDPSTNAPIHAKDALPGTKYKCIYCNCDSAVVYRKTSPKGIPYFYRQNLSAHTSKICQRLTKAHIVHDPSLLDPTSFFKLIMTPDKENNTTTAISSGTLQNSPHASSKMPIVSTACNTVDTIDEGCNIQDDIEKVLAPSSLKHIADEELYRYGPNFILANGQKLSELIICRSWGYLYRNIGSNLGYRILEGYFHRVNYRSNSLVFKVACNINGQKTTEQHFAIKFKDKKIFRKYYDKLAVPKLDNGKKSVTLRANQAVLIAGEWTLKNAEACRKLCYTTPSCAKCSGLYCTDYHSSRQIYLYPTDD